MQAVLIELLRQHLRFPIRTAENQALDTRATEAVKFSLTDDMLDAALPRELLQQAFVMHLVRRIRPPAQADIVNAKIMERAEQILGQSLLQADFVSNIMVKQRVNIKTIRPIGAGRHAEAK